VNIVLFTQFWDWIGRNSFLGTVFQEHVHFLSNADEEHVFYVVFCCSFLFLQERGSCVPFSINKPIEISIFSCFGRISLHALLRLRQKRA